MIRRLLISEHVEFSKHLSTHYFDKSTYVTHPESITHFYNTRDNELNIFGYFEEENLACVWCYLPYDIENHEIAGGIFVRSRLTSIPLVGLKTLKYGLESLGNPVVITPGIAPHMQKFHTALGFRWDQMDHMLLLTDSDQSKEMEESHDVIDVINFDVKLLPESDFLPHKRAFYFTNRYATHPFLKFQVGRISRDGKDGVFVLHLAKFEGRDIVRFYDYFGPRILFKEAMLAAVSFAVSQGCWYIDCVSYGVYDDLKELGFQDAFAEQTFPRITNYFWPPNKSLVRVNLAILGTDPGQVVLFRGSGDVIVPRQLPPFD